MTLNPLPGMTHSGSRWAFNLIKREASGEQLNDISKMAWREVFQLPKDADAKAALKACQVQEAAA